MYEIDSATRCAIVWMRLVRYVRRSNNDEPSTRPAIQFLPDVQRQFHPRVDQPESRRNAGGEGEELGSTKQVTTFGW